MKTISDYTIFCTEAQTRKALELGASIELESEYYNPTEHDFKLDNPIPCESFTNGYHYAKCPTAEQMCGWLEEIFSEIDICKEGKGFCYDIFYLHKRVRGRSDFDTRQEATLAAIDAALKYLSK